MDAQSELLIGEAHKLPSTFHLVQSQCRPNRNCAVRLKMVFSTECLGLLLCFSLGLLNLASGLNFTLTDGDFKCNSNLFCLDQAHVDDGSQNRGEDLGRISLLDQWNPYQATGVVYYRNRVEMVNRRAQQVASFSTSFSFYSRSQSVDEEQLQVLRGDGFTFVMSASRSWRGWAGSKLGIFADSGQPKLFVVEYDFMQNKELDDINDDHIGVDTTSPTSLVSADVTPLNISLWTGTAVRSYSWIDYDSDSKELQVRIAKTFSKPDDPLLTYTIDLSTVIDEYMWLGFSASTGDSYSYYYITDWDFTSTALGPRESGGNNVGLIVGVTLGAVFLVLVVIGVLAMVLWRKLRRKRTQLRRDEEILSMPGMPDSFTYRQLTAATKSFSEGLGGGGFGNVYAGVLGDVRVAVKRMKPGSRQGEREFLAEVSIISQIRHRNVVQLLGYCRDRGQLLLVYELLPRGGLDVALFSPKSPESVLTWLQRLKIISGVAAALHYLHEGWKQQVIHRDVKSSNVMLDHEYNAKLGDFGLARLVDHDATSGATTLVAGTYGYLAPEATGTGKFTEKSDVYAFGAVALEVVCGRKAYDGSLQSDASLVDVVWRHLGQGKLMEMADKKMVLEEDQDRYDIEVVLLLGLLCSHPDPESRPPMRQVEQVLAGDAPVPPVPMMKPSPVYALDLPEFNLSDARGSKGTSASSTGPSFTSTLSNSSPSFIARRNQLKLESPNQL